MIHIGERLQEIRKDHKLTQKQLAGILGISWRTVGAYETNACMPDYEVLVNISKHFNVSLDYLLGLVDEQFPIQREPIMIPDGLSSKSIDSVKDYIKFLHLKEKGFFKK